MIKTYQINVAAKTKGGADLASGWSLAILATSKEEPSYRLVVLTCDVPNGSIILDPYVNLDSGGVQVYSYAPATDNAKSENLMLTNTFEADLDTWFGAGNWVVV